MRVLVAVDDHSAASAIAGALGHFGNEVHIAHDAATTRAALSHASHASAVFDYGGLDGACAELLALCDGLPSVPATLVLCREVEVSELFDVKVRPREYALKASTPESVALRLQALMQGDKGNMNGCLRASGIVLDPQARVVFRMGRAMQLPPKEFDLLHLLMSRAGEIVTREEASDWLYRWGQDIESNALDVHIHALRRRLWHGLIRTVRGQGHVLLDAQVDPAAAATPPAPPQQPE